LRDFETPILVECKSSPDPLGSRDVAWFLLKLECRSREFGILVALGGITGDPNPKSSAHEIVARFLSFPKKVRLIVFARSDIVSLTSTDDLVRLVKAKYCDLIARGTVFP
jgi:hypothetical protein